ncbi:tetratricopeptide repeat-containing S1 family peptidase [Oxynema aestuarii]|uniref:Serine protease n=1 Tax=Oxynema aestuarii AP17 TaxID=2064643 RepID=A0A6H1TUG2_9CYAN|nr:tetratricopeptide repeat-containing serine protease family protein [Oxynema aestuarii]QIZ69787.1 serine protease [Oxynema aestuarii AP17]
MSRNYSQFDSLTAILAGTITVAGLVTFAPSPIFAKSAQEIAQIAVPVTVQINGESSKAIRSGSGFIIAKDGTKYTILTCDHVIDDSQFSYNIRTHTGKDYSVTSIVRLAQNQNQPDLAIVTFSSTESYPVVTLSNSDRTAIGSEIFVFGYPANILNKKVGTNRNFEFSPGFVTSLLDNHPSGYTLRYNAITKGGMSGGPVFDSEGRVIGIHGQGDRDYDWVLDNQGKPTGRTPTKTGFNSAIPINMFLSKLSEVGLNRSAFAIDDSPTTNVPIAVDNPNNAQTFYVRGLSRFDRADFSGAIADFTQAIQNQQNYSEAFFYRALAYFELDDLGKSLVDYTTALEIAPAYADAYYNRALVRAEMGDLLGSIDDYTQVIRLDRTFAAAYNNRGLALSDLGDQQQAIDDFNQALHINPGRSNTYFNRGLALFRIGNYRAALADYTQAIQLNPNYAKAYANRGITLAKIGDRQGAISDLQQAARLFEAQGMSADAQKASEMASQLQQ